MAVTPKKQTASVDQASQETSTASFVNPSVAATNSLLSVGHNFNFLSSGIGAANEQLEPIMKQLNKLSAQVGQVDIVTIDEKLEFPTLVVGAYNASDNRYYYAALLVTGKNPRATHTVEGYLGRVDELTSTQTMFGQTKPKSSDVSILLQDNVLNDKVINIIIGSLPESQAKDVVGTGYYTLSLTEEVSEDTAREIAVMLVNSILMGAIVENNQTLDKGIIVGKDVNWRIDVNLIEEKSGQTGRDVCGHYYARPIIIQSKGSKTQDIGALGVTSGIETIMESQVCGVIDYKFATIPEHVDNGIRVPAQTKACPEFIITKFSSTHPSITSFLLNLANSIQIMSKKECSYACQMATKGKSNHFANMNIVTNVENNENGVGVIYKAKDLTPELSVSFLDKALAPDAGTIMSMKIDPTNSESYINQVILGLLHSDEKVRVYFRSLITNSVKVLTGRNSITPYDGDIIVPVVAKYPIGTFAGTTGVMSLDLLNVNEFIDMIKGNELMDILVEMNNARSNPEACCNWNGKTFDSFIGALKAMKVGGLGDARITGMGYKVTFHPDFIGWLVDNINSTGYTPIITAPTTNAHVIERTFSQGAFNLGARGNVNAVSFGTSYSFGTVGNGFGRDFSFRR